MHHVDDDRTLSDRCCDPFDVSGPRIAYREYAGQAGFERSAGVGIGAHEALVVERHAGPGQPRGIRLCADK